MNIPAFKFSRYLFCQNSISLPFNPVENEIHNILNCLNYDIFMLKFLTYWTCWDIDDIDKYHVRYLKFF